MATITFTILPAKVQRLLDGVLGVFPNTDSGNYSDIQWAKEVIRKQIIKWVQRHERDQAYAAIDIKQDDSIIS